MDADGIPIWNPNNPPPIVVNQLKISADSRCKDIKIEDFDIAFAGQKILTNATLTLNYGRRYGMVGKNGIGKSTLLRAIANKELLIPTHIKILHVEQEAAGGSTTALKSVLEADVERESLIQEEIALNNILSNPKSTHMESTKASNRLKAVYAKMEEIEADKAESR